MEARERRVELYRERVEAGLEPYTGRPPPPQRGVEDLPGAVEVLLGSV